MQAKTKSPLKAKPLRNPGQSLDEEIEKLINEDAGSYIFVTISIIIFTVYEWIRWYCKSEYHPLVATFIMVITICISIYNLKKIRKRLKLLRLGRDGEKAVGQFLELMRERGYKVFHDFIGDNFNIDHVIVCKYGIFTVETKTFSKPLKGKPRIQYNGKRITVNGRETISDILEQAKAEAFWLRHVIRESTGKKYEVKPVIVFPGWYIENSAAGYNPNVWVLNPKALAEFIPKSGINLQDEEIHLISSTIGRFIRNDRIASL